MEEKFNCLGYRLAVLTSLSEENSNNFNIMLTQIPKLGVIIGFKN